MAKNYSPLAQSFIIDSTDFPNGAFLHSISVFFKKKDAVSPITLDVRPTVNGYPDNKIVYAGSTIVKYPSEIKVRSGTEQDLPVGDDIYSSTNFIFSSPLCLLPGSHCFVFSTSSLNYELFVNKLGDKSLNTGTVVSFADSFTGNMFISSNSSAYVAEPTMNLMYKLNICKFDTNNFGLVKFDSYDKTLDGPGIFNYNTFNITKADARPGDTSINYFYAATTLSEGMYSKKLDEWTPCQVNTNITIAKEKSVFNNTELYPYGSSFSVLAGMKTDDPYVSPIVSNNLSSAIFVKNKINYGEVTTKNFEVLYSGEGYGPKVVITGTNTMAAFAAPVIEAGVIKKIVVYNGGAGYSSPSVSLVGTTGTGCVLGTPIVDSSTGAILHIPLDYNPTTYEEYGGSGYGPTITVSYPDLPDGDFIRIYPNIGLDPGNSIQQLQNDTLTKSLAQVGKITGFDMIPAVGYANEPTLTIVHNKAKATANLSATTVNTITVDYGGFGYVSGGVTVTIVGDGTGATATATVTNGVITAIAVGAHGTGYSYANVVITSTTDFQMIPTGFENSQNYGTAIARYITKQIALENVADRIQVIMDINRPAGTELLVYAKYQHPEDGEKFEQKKWVQMQLPDGVLSLPTSKNDYDFNEVKLLLKDIIYTTTAGTYTGFGKLAIKIAMFSKDVCVVPKVRNFRALALK